MNELSQRGLEVARQISLAYAADPNVSAVMLSGSVARGYADAYSDLEIGVFWQDADAPSDVVRTRHIKSVGGELWSMQSFGMQTGQIVNEHYGLSHATIDGWMREGTLMVDTKHATLAYVEQCLHDVIEGFDTSMAKQSFLAAIQDGIALHGQELVEHWQSRARAYPDRLAIKVIQQHLWFGPWFPVQAYIDRDDQLVLWQHLIWMQHNVLRVLAGLNRVYYPSAEHKWAARLIARFALKPNDLAARLNAALHMSPQMGIQSMLEIVQEVISLVEQHCPDVNRISMFDERSEVTTDWAGKRWQPQPPYSLLTGNKT